MSKLIHKISPFPNKTIINEKAGLFNHVWNRWLSDLYNFISTKINYAIAVPTELTTINNTTSETVLVSGSIGSNNLFEQSFLTLKAIGVASTGLNAGTLTLRLRIGTETLTGAIISELAITPDNSKTDVSWSCEFNISIASTGTSCQLIGNGFFLHALSNSSYTGSTSKASSTIDSTATNLIELTAQYSVADSSNSITSTNSIIAIKNLEY